MSEAPKRIALDCTGQAFERQENGFLRRVGGPIDGTTYVRADIADETLEALKEARGWGYEDAKYAGRLAYLDAAIAKAEGKT